MLKYILLTLLVVIGLAMAFTYGLAKHDQNECHYWYEAAYDFTPLMKQQCNYWMIYK